MFDIIINNRVLNEICIGALDVKSGIFRSVPIILLLVFSISLFSIEMIFEKINPHGWFKRGTMRQPQIKTAS